MPTFKKPKFHPNFPDKTLTVSDTQDSFGFGAIKEEYWGRSTKEEFQGGVKLLQNFDIQEQNTLVKRSGTVEDKNFKEFKSRSLVQAVAGRQTGLRLPSFLSNMTHYVEEVTVKDYKIEFFKETFVLVVCWRTENIYFRDAVDPQIEGIIGTNSVARNDIWVYAGRKGDLEKLGALNDAEDVEGGFFSTFSFLDSFDIRISFGSTPITHPVTRREDITGFASVYIKGGPDTLSTAGITIKSVRGGRDYMVISSFTHPVAISVDGGGWSARWLGFPGPTVKPGEFVVAGIQAGLIRAVSSLFNSRYYEMGFQPQRYYREGIRILSGRVFFDIKYRGGAAIEKALEGLGALSVLLDSDGAKADAAKITALKNTLPTWARDVTDSEQGFTFLSGGSYLVSGGEVGRVTPNQIIVSDAGILVDNNNKAKSVITLKDDLSDTKPLIEDMAGFSTSNTDRGGRALPSLISELGSEGVDNPPNPAPPAAALTTAEKTEIINSGSGTVLVKMDEEVLKDCFLDEDLKVGYILVFLNEISGAGGDPTPVDSGKVKLCEVRAFDDFDRFSTSITNRENFPNAVLTFFTEAFIRSARGYEDLDHLGFENITNLHYTLSSSKLTFRQFSLPAFSVGRGFPSSVTKVDAKAVLGGFGNNRVLFGSLGSGASPTFGFSGFIPSKFVFTKADVQKIVDGEVNLVRPSSQTGPDDLFYFNAQLNPAILPFEIESDIGSNNEVFWVDTIRDLIIGTRVEETRARTVRNEPVNAGNIDLRGFQSARGSGSYLTAKGDYSLFFVGPNRDEIYFFWYDDAISGLRTRNATVIGGNLVNIIDMRWDYRRKALWVVHGDGLISLFYLSKEYGIMGWGDYLFDNPTGGGFGNRYKAHGLFHNADRSVGFTAKGGKLITIPFDRGDGKYIDASGNEVPIPYQDDGGNRIVSRVEFFRNPPQSRSGAATIWKKRQGVCDLLCRTVTEIFAGGVSRKENRDALSRTSQQKSDRGVYSYSLQGQESSVLQDGKLLFVTVEHHKPERAEILSISSRYEILEV